MRISTIILDTNEYIYGLTGRKKSCVDLISKLSSFKVKIPRIILDELHKNLSDIILKDLYELLGKEKVDIVYEKVSIDLVNKYQEKVPYEDAVIASYCELLKIDVLISENRHFLIGFNPKNFQVFSAHDFLKNVGPAT